MTEDDISTLQPTSHLHVKKTVCLSILFLAVLSLLMLFHGSYSELNGDIVKNTREQKTTVPKQGAFKEQKRANVIKMLGTQLARIKLDTSKQKGGNLKSKPKPKRAQKPRKAPKKKTTRDRTTSVSTWPNITNLKVPEESESQKLNKYETLSTQKPSETQTSKAIANNIKSLDEPKNDTELQKWLGRFHVRDDVPKIKVKGCGLQIFNVRYSREREFVNKV